MSISGSVCRFVLLVRTLWTYSKLCDIAAQELCSAEHLFNGPHLNAKIQQTKKTAKRQCGGKVSRPNLPRASVEVMEAWFCVHQDNPYPSEEEKRALAMQLNLKEEQVSNWFVNVRKRFWRLKEGKQTGAIRKVDE